MRVFLMLHVGAIAAIFPILADGTKRDAGTAASIQTGGSVEETQEQPAPADSDTKKEEVEPDHPIHDFSRLTGRDEDSCSACHLPHVQTGSEVTGNQAAGDLFRIARQRPVLAPGRYTPGPTSLICLTCHNGSIAVSTLGTAHAMRDAGRTPRPPDFATRDHPIGVPYPDRQEGYKPRARVEAEEVVKLPEGRVECISCHDQHEEEGYPYLLVMSNRRSALCLACHEK